MKRWFWKRWAWTGVFGITAAVGLALGAGKDAPPSTAAPPKVGDVMTLKFQNGPEKHVKVLKTQKRADGSYQSEVRDMKSGEVFTLVDKTHMPHAIAPTVPAVPARQASTPTAINAKPVNTQPKPIDTHISIPETKTAPPKLPAPGFSPSASMQFADPLLSDMGGATPAAASDRKLFAPSKPKTVAAPAPMPEPTPEPQKRPGFFKRLFGKDTPAAAPKVTTLTPPGTISAAPSRPGPKSTPSFMPPSSVFESGPGQPPSKKSAPTFMPPSSVFESGSSARPGPKPVPPLAPSDLALEPGAGATQPAPHLGAGTATVRAPRLFPSRPSSANESSRGKTSRPDVGSALDSSPNNTPEPPRSTSPVVKPPVAQVPTTVMPPTAPPGYSPLPIPNAPAAIPAPAVSTPRTIAPLTPAPSIPAMPALPALPMPATASPVVPAIPSGPALPTIPALPGGMSVNHAPVRQAGFVSQAAVALAHDIQPHVTALRTAAAPSMRVMAARALAGGRHASTDSVKSILFIACTSDPAPFVRACCIDELCKLGYYDPAFVVHLNRACGDPSEEVRTAAKEALKKMMPQR